MIRDTFDMFQEPERGRFGDNELASEQSTSSPNDYGPVECALWHETPKAILVSIGREESGAVWISKFKKDGTPLATYTRRSIHGAGGFRGCTKHNGHSVRLPVIAVTVPEWLAKEKGLV